MRILQILPELNVGGVETGTVDFAKYLIDNNHHAVVVSNGGVLVEKLENVGAKHYFLPVHKKSLWTILKSVRALQKIIIQEKIDIVHARSRVPGWIGYFATRKTQAKFITTCHGHYSNHFFSSVMGWSKIVIVPSEVIGRHMIDNFKVPSENIRSIPRSVDLKRFNVKREESKGPSCRVSIVGRITPLKGHRYFLKAMAKVVRSMPFVKIWIIGDAPAKKEGYKKELEILVRRLGLTDNVEFLGTRQDVPQLLAQSDVLVMSSVEPESFGRVILEAQAVGVPVVATKIGGAIEIIDDEKTGLLVHPKAIDEMSYAVMRLLNDKKLSREFQVAARKKIEEKYTVEHMSDQTIDCYNELLGSLNILVIKMSALGDVILTTAALKAIRKKFNKAKIYCLVSKESRELLQRCPYIDEMIVIDLKHSYKSLFRVIKFSKKLRKYKFDKIIDFQNNLKSHLLTFLSFPHESYGFNNGEMGFVLTNAVENPNNELPPVRHQFQILDMLGINSSETHELELWPSDNDRKKVKEILENEWIGVGTKIVGINVSASERWPTKNWPTEHIARLSDILGSLNVRTVITGMTKDLDLAREIVALSKTKPVVLAGKTNIMELAALIERCGVFVTPDSSPMHISAAMKTPFVAFFGPTASSRHLPPAKSYRVFEKDLECAPCYSCRCRILTHACLKGISPEDVAEKIQELLKENK